MEKSLQKTILKLSKETAFILLTVVSAVILPQIFHGLGLLLGVGGTLGQIFLPMYIPVLILGFYRGPVSGAIVGLLAPLVSFAFTEMPTKAVLPYIALELIATGALAGLFAKAKFHAVFRVLSVQVIAKIIRLVAFAIALYFTSGNISSTVLFSGVVESIPGVVIQICLLTYLISKKEKTLGE